MRVRLFATALYLAVPAFLASGNPLQSLEERMPCCGCEGFDGVSSEFRINEDTYHCSNSVMIYARPEWIVLNSWT